MVENIDTSKIPTHIAIIMDGNGRWAIEHGKDRVFGHQNGVESVRSVIEGAGEIGVKYLTLYAFSTENWSRPKEEVDALMSLLVKSIKLELNNLMKNKVRLLSIGDLNTLPLECKEELLDAINTTQNNTGLTVVLALSYSSKWELTDALKKIATQVKNGLLSPEQINEDTIQKNLNTCHIPDPDILLRTGREQRISNFLLWQIAYAELFFSPILWPDFRKEDLFNVIKEYNNRERRFGKTSEQLINQ
ncbi:MAG: isoprenyl transferase [Bacteroidetes bacterium HGW-Bacteroidetes-19]|nr:MAG: isoprenyl transferase [Bacteroidetes bacterium HGW-Bacteroidetes-20]PKP27481.1 MAG: isoprenyl transferase [Bacteroidetes bacterium HGW-Bacteroidetes-19]